MKLKTKLLVIGLLITCISIPEYLSAKYTNRAHAKTKGRYDKDSYAWLNFGIGGSTYGLASGLSMNIQNENRLFTVRYVNNVEECFFCNKSPLLRSYDFGILYGISSRNGKSAYASISGGISLVGYTDRGKYLGSEGNMIFSTSKYETITGNTIGFPIESQLFVHGKSIGIGVVAFANINPHKSYGGALLCLQIGGLK